MNRESANMTVQLAQNVWDAFTSSYSYGPLQDDMKPYT